MGPLFLQTAIAEQRVSHHGQPPWETIALDSVVRLPSVVRHIYAETVRFGDYRRRGGESVRYYHFLAYSRGQTLSIPASGASRLISGLYEGRQITLSRAPRPLQTILSEEADLSKPLSMASYAMVRLVTERDEVIARFNCLEAFISHFTLSASVRIPELLLLNSAHAASFDDLLAQHGSISGPAFQPITCASVDATLVIDIPRAEASACQAKIQFGIDHEVNISSPEIFLIA